MDCRTKVNHILIAIDIISSTGNSLSDDSIRDHIIATLQRKQACTMENILACEVAIRTIEYLAKNGFNQIQTQLFSNIPARPQQALADNRPRRPLLNELFNRLTWMERIPPNPPLTTLFIDMTSGCALATHIFYGHLNRFLMTLMKWFTHLESHLESSSWRDQIICTEPILTLEQNLKDGLRILTIFNRRYIIRTAALLYHYEKICETFNELGNALLVDISARANTPEWNVQFAMIDRELLNLTALTDTLFMSHSFFKRL